jgi:hypothetical protein
MTAERDRRRPKGFAVAVGMRGAIAAMLVKLPCVNPLFVHMLPA